MDVSKLTDMFDSRLMPQMIENPMDNIIRQINEDTETYICKRLIALDIDKDILMNQTQEIRRLNGVIAEYERLEEQGLLLRLPFPLGTTVYYVDLDERDYNYIVCEAKFSLSLLESKKKLYATFEEASANKRRFGER